MNAYPPLRSNGLSVVRELIKPLGDALPLRAKKKA